MKLLTHHLLAFSDVTVVWNTFYFRNQNIICWQHLVVHFFPLNCLYMFFCIILHLLLHWVIHNIHTTIAFCPFEWVTISLWQWMQLIASVTVLTTQVQLSPIMPLTLKETFIHSNTSVKSQFCELPDHGRTWNHDTSCPTLEDGDERLLKTTTWGCREADEFRSSEQWNSLKISLCSVPEFSHHAYVL